MQEKAYRALGCAAAPGTAPWEQLLPTSSSKETQMAAWPNPGTNISRNYVALPLTHQLSRGLRITHHYRPLPKYKANSFLNKAASAQQSHMNPLQKALSASTYSQDFHQR